MGANDEERTDAPAGGGRAVEEPAQRVLSDREILAYGRMAARGAGEVVTAAFEAIKEFDPEFVDRARAVWNELRPELPRQNLMGNVTIKWLFRHPYEPMRTTETVSAWTNSRTEVYVRRPEFDDEGTVENEVDEKAYWRVILYHEALHVQQFATSGGPPATYVKMMAHEEDAYRKTHEWLQTTTHPDPYPDYMVGYIDPMKKIAEVFADKIAAVENETSDVHEQNEKYKEFLLGESFLPPHDDISDLYGR